MQRHIINYDELKGYKAQMLISSGNSSSKERKRIWVEVIDGRATYGVETTSRVKGVGLSLKQAVAIYNSL